MTRGAAASGLLAGTLVVDAGQGVAAGFASWLLADLGARIVTVEPPGGGRLRQLGPFPGDAFDVEAGGLHVALDAGKESVVLDLEAEPGRRALRELLDAADVYIARGPSLVDSLAIAGEPPLAAALPALRSLRPMARALREIRCCSSRLEQFSHLRLRRH
jgi:crotonobetainyl-CoA:carnitine CoA-transferase CaiB-like acyl-CoA transferase